MESVCFVFHSAIGSMKMWSFQHNFNLNTSQLVLMLDLETLMKQFYFLLSVSESSHYKLFVNRIENSDILYVKYLKIQIPSFKSQAHPLYILNREDEATLSVSYPLASEGLGLYLLNYLCRFFRRLHFYFKLKKRKK